MEGRALRARSGSTAVLAVGPTGILPVDFSSEKSGLQRSHINARRIYYNRTFSTALAAIHPR
jgi:hypothetical protein